MDDGVVPRDTQRGGLVGGVIVALILAALLGGAGWWALTLRQRERSPQGVEETLLKDRTVAPLFRALKEGYPQEFLVLRGLVSQRLREGVPPAGIPREIRAWLTGFTRRHLPELAQAPPGDLRFYRQLEIDLAEALERESIPACARFAMAGLGDHERLPRELEIQLVDFAAQQIAVSAAGRDHPMKRVIPTGPLARPDAVALVQAVRKAGMRREDFDVWTDSAKLDRAPPAQQCAINRYVLNGINALPAAQADRVTGWLAVAKTRM